jgi:hypothetical protein
MVRLLNSTPLGEVISERQLLRHRTRAGFHIGEGRHINLLRYVAWLVAIRNEPQAEEDSDPYESLKERARARNAALSLAGRDIGEIPAVVDPARKAQAATDFRFFCETYFPAAFSSSGSACLSHKSTTNSRTAFFVCAHDLLRYRGETNATKQRQYKRIERAHKWPVLRAP